MIAALREGSTKRLAATGSFISLPRCINAGDGSGRLITEPMAVMEETREYFSTLYGRLPPVATPKPWLTTPSVERGNQRPSPGPDQYLILDLHNYVVTHSRFPGSLKDMWITMFHKRGLLTDLTNWRGLFLSNFLANSLISWLTSRLTVYSSRMGIIPETQVAVQQGVQTRDPMSFLAGIKGFDYLAPEGFYDAIRAYGLPQSIIDLDRVSQTDPHCRIRTYHGPTSPIVVSSVTKQGGPTSPLKAIYTTSLGQRYLDDIAASDTAALVISTTNALNADPGDAMQVTITSITHAM
ncbi:hypothetical protein DFH09DRAFT_1247832 [Mycena vulgaris]|nr:hypothetical protein DFH09DRAFT_1247832 [Mycena vulgaris]